ncbi:hypothetical protein LENED_000929 [Lentinula edodes]|uniref:Uncharacterized protein n=1 Tax=Lentinula edodes TaxID=5353 RepID=A0A1Q3DWT6_LENED|nr:hypothetical protein LENED_000929 [Lentinula edodes]
MRCDLSWETEQKRKCMMKQRVNWKWGECCSNMLHKRLTISTSLKQIKGAELAILHDIRNIVNTIPPYWKWDTGDPVAAVAGFLRVFLGFIINTKIVTTS